MRYTMLRPSHALRSEVECFWRLDGSGSGLPDETIVPDGCLEIVLHLGDRFERVAPGGGTATQPRAFVVGQMLGPLVVRPAARVETWGVRFRPGGAAPYLGGAVRDLTGRIVDLESVWGSEGERIVARLLEARTVEARRAVLQAMLLARRRREADPLAAAAAGAVVASRGVERMGTLAARAGVGRRQLERRFLSEVGLPAATLARIVRFQQVFRLVNGHGGADGAAGAWADVACAAGYYDQAHLLRDFRQFAGSTPPRFLSGQGEFSRVLTGPDRLDDLFAAGNAGPAAPSAG